MLVDQYPGAQLGQEPQILQLVKSGDIDFAIVSSANTSTISPQAGVMSLHFLFSSEAHNVKALADPKVIEAIRDMIDDTAQGIHVIGLATQGFRNMYGKKEIHKVDDLKGLQGSRPGHRDRGHHVRRLWRPDRAHAVRQRLYLAADRRDGFRRERVNVYLVNKHYEVAPVLSMTEHEANNAIVWISDKLWQSLSPSRSSGCLTAGGCQRARNRQARFRSRAFGGQPSWRNGRQDRRPMSTRPAFQKIADPYLDKLAKELGPHADKIKTLIRAIN